MSKDVRLQVISDSEYESWIIESKKNYCNEMVKNGLTFDEASDRTERDFGSLLPEGKSTKDHFIFSIKGHEDENLGTLWFGLKGALNNRKAFIYDIALYESARGKGHGQKTMELLELEVKKLGLSHIWLHVFGHNKIARSLYEKMGYEITNLVMEKKI